MCSSMPCSTEKKINKTSWFVERIIDTAADGLDSWSRVRLLTAFSLWLGLYS